MLADGEVHGLAGLRRPFIGRWLRVLIVDEAAQAADTTESRDANAGVGHDHLAVGAHRAEAGQAPRRGRARQWGAAVLPDRRLAAGPRSRWDRRAPAAAAPPARPVAGR